MDLRIFLMTSMPYKTSRIRLSRSKSPHEKNINSAFSLLWETDTLSLLIRKTVKDALDTKSVTKEKYKSPPILKTLSSKV